MPASRFTLFAALSLLVGMSEAFAPINAPSSRTTALQFGFLKELGLEKPSWLPDFGSKEDEEEAPGPAAVETEEETEEAEAEAEESSEE